MIHEIMKKIVITCDQMLYLAASMSLRQPSDSSRLLGSDMHIVIEKVDAPTPTDFLAPSLSNDPVDMEPRFISSKVTPNNSFYRI